MDKSSLVGILIRPAVLADLPAIAEIWWQLALEHEARDPGYWGLARKVDGRETYRQWKETFFTEEAQEFHIHLVAEKEGVIAGFVHGQIMERPEIFSLRSLGRINEVAVHRDFRGQGIGRAMMEALEAEFLRREVDSTHLMVDADNSAAQKLYYSLGYRVREYHLVKLR